MSTATSIEWTDTTWNPVTGCTRVSAGCKNCYAEGVAKRFWKGRKFTDVRCHEDRLDEPLRWRKPRRVFVNSMSDLFHDDVPLSFIARVFDVMACATAACGKRHRHEEECWTGPSHTFQILTKRAERMQRVLDRELMQWASENMPGDCPLMVNADVGNWPLPNVWLGVSVEDQAAADARIPQLLQTPAALRFLSCEPLLSDVDLSRIDDTGGRGTWDVLRRAPTNDGQRNVGTGIDWVIVGGESGPRARPCDVGWIRSIVAQCKAASVPCFVKQIGANVLWNGIQGGYGDGPSNLWPNRQVGPLAETVPSGGFRVLLRDRKGGNPAEWPDDLRVREFPAEATA